MKRNIWTVVFMVAAVMVASCGDSEPDTVEDTDEQTEVEEVTETVEETEIAVEPDSTETIPVEEVVEVEEEVPAITTIALPEPWPVDFPIPDCFEVISNELNEDGNQVLIAAVPEGTDRPGVWDLGYFFRDNMENWSIASEDNMDCVLTSLSFNVPLTQGTDHILVHGWFDTGNIMTVELTWTKDAE